MIANDTAEKYGFVNDGRLLTLRADKAVLAPPKWAEDTKAIDVDVICGFVNLFLLKRFDNPLPIASFHKLLWELVLCRYKYVAIAAPRGISKTTSVSLVMVLALLLFRVRRFVLLISSVESLASAFIESIRTEVMENPELKRDFGIANFQRDNETELVIEFTDGYTCCVRGRGFDQKFRGILWRGMRPGAIIGDDMEDDEAVMNPERRKKSQNKLMHAILPCGSDTCVYRIVGTVIHMDSVLNRLLHNAKWVTLLSQAQSDDKKSLLWEDKLPEHVMTELREMYENEGDLEGFYKEYFNRPVAEGATFFQRSDFQPMTKEDHARDKVYFAGMDFAISEAQTADYTVIIIAGMDSDGILHVVEVVRVRCSSDITIDEMLRVQDRYKIDIFTVEAGAIEKSIGPFLNLEMLKQTIFLNLNKVTPSKSKTARAKSIQMLMRAGAVKFDTEAGWFDLFVQEQMSIAPSGPKGAHDDQFDAFAYLGLGVDKYRQGMSQEDIKERKDNGYEDEEGPSMFDTMDGACSVAGY